ncbi:hypothetical protein [Sphingomonas faeni]|uniref:hypothetical protein n=1 Tax=Sphingomonas faeni TaxID=185950 RepID=UPI0033495551
MFAGIPPGIDDREIATARKLLDWPDEAFAVKELPESQVPGNILLLEAAFEHVTEVVSGFGKLGMPTERVTQTAVSRMAGYLASDVFAGPYLAHHCSYRLRWQAGAHSRRKAEPAPAIGPQQLSNVSSTAYAVSFSCPPKLIVWTCGKCELLCNRFLSATVNA